MRRPLLGLLLCLAAVTGCARLSQPPPIQVPVGSSCTVLDTGLACTPPAAPTYDLTIALTGGGTATTSVAPPGPQTAGTTRTLTVTPTNNATLGAWSAGCADTMAQPAAHTICTRTVTPSVPIPPSGLDWTKLADLNPAERNPSWYNLAMDEQGRAYSLTWDGELWRFDPATNTSAKVAQWQPSSSSPHNCAITYAAGKVWLTGLCASGGSGQDMRAYWYDVVTGTTGVHCPTWCGAGSNSAGVWDRDGQRILGFAGALADLSYYDRMHIMNPATATWTSVSINPYPPPQVPFQNYCDRFTYSRAGYDGKRTRAWAIMSNGNLWTLPTGTNTWTERPTTGTKPSVCTVYAYHEGLDRIIGWTGIDSDVGSAPMVRKTWQLDLDTLVWSEVGTANAPGGGASVVTSIGYDRVRAQVIVRTLGGSFWALKGQAGPPPATYALAVQASGPGTVAGGGSYAAGAAVTLTATPTGGATFTGWSPSPCAATFAMPAAPLTCVATFLPATGGDFPAWPTRVFKALAQPTDKLKSWTVRGSKDVQRVWDAKRQRILWGTGDYSSDYWINTGQNTIFSGHTRQLIAATPATPNEGWGLAVAACHEAGQISPPRPTDRGIFVIDEQRDELLLWSRINEVQPGGTCSEQSGQGSTYTDGLLAISLNQPNARWRVAAPRGAVGNTLSMGAYSAKTHQVVYLSDVQTCPYGGFTVRAMALSNYSDASTVTSCWLPETTPAGLWVSDQAGYQATFGWDAEREEALVCVVYIKYTSPGSGVSAERRYGCHLYAHATRTLTPVAPVPPAPPVPGWYPKTYYVHLVYDSVNKKFLWPVSTDAADSQPACGLIHAMWVYDRPTNTWENIPVALEGITEAKPRGTLSVFDPTTNLMVVGSTGFCDPPLMNNTPPFAWRYR